MIKICDSIMGSGKTMSTITYLNEHPHDKFVYITPYLEEAERIKRGCPTLNFIEPSDRIPQYHFRKSEHTAALLSQGKNISTTHQAFKRYTPEMLDDIRRQGYTLIIDENVDILEAFSLCPTDLQIAIETGYVKEHDNVYSATDKQYDGLALKELLDMLKSRELISIDDNKNGTLYYWTLPPDLLTAFKDVFVLTYLFSGQSLHHFMKIYDLPYQYIGIEKTKDGGFRFGDYPGYTPEYVYNLKDTLHILDVGKLNDIGNGRTALSMTWYKNNPEKTKQLKNNIYNYVNNVWEDIPANQKLWGSYAGEFSKIKGKGYTKSFLTFNAKATNSYRDRKYLVYIVNLFMNVVEKKFYEAHGITVDEDMYALSIMVQWIWRSAIRDGGEVYLYIPSKRMRTILTKWIEKTSKEGNIVYEKAMQ